MTGYFDDDAEREFEQWLLRCMEQAWEQAGGIDTEQALAELKENYTLRRATDELPEMPS